MTIKQPRWRFGTADFSPVITPSPGTEWTVTRSAQEEMLWIPFEYCRLTVWPISENFLEEGEEKERICARKHLRKLSWTIFVHHLNL
jgi:hypothetical protein